MIGGWLPQKGSDEELGALLAGYYEDPGKDAAELRFAGKVGTGFSREEARKLVGLLRERAREDSPFSGRQPQRGARFTEPDLVAEVDYGELTREGMLRHPAYKGLRTDKDSREVGLELPEDSAAPGEPAAPGELPVAEDGALFDVRAVPAPRGKGGVEVEVEGRTLRLTNLDKVLYPATGFTKRDLIDHYVRVSGVLLPHLHDRPLTLKRYPDGVEGGHFFEKQCPSHRPEWIETARVPSERKGTIEFCLVNDLPSLVWIANLADLELHPSLSTAADLEHPTAMAFDLDPGPGEDLVDCCQVAIWIRGMLGNLGVECFPKVSGKKGLHLFVPLNGTAGYETDQAVRAPGRGDARAALSRSGHVEHGEVPAQGPRPRRLEPERPPQDHPRAVFAPRHRAPGGLHAAALGRGRARPRGGGPCLARLHARGDAGPGRRARRPLRTGALARAGAAERLSARRATDAFATIASWPFALTWTRSSSARCPRRSRAARSA